MKREDLTGQKFNYYTFLQWDSVKNKKTYWICKCDCGNVRVVQAYNVKSGKSKSCGCLSGRNEYKPDLKFNLLTSVQFDSKDEHGHALWLFRCDCGNEKVIRFTSVIDGNTISCGCMSSRCPDNLVGQNFERLNVVKMDSIGKNRAAKWLCLCSCGNYTIVETRSLKNGSIRRCGCLQKETASAICSKRTGKDNPNWDDSITDEERKFGEENRQLCPKYRKWRLKVYKRDNYICQCCYSKTKIRAHHIYSFRSNKKLRYVASNGITLCEACHKKFHKEYGYGNNTRKQLNKFLKEYKENKHEIY